LKRKRKKGKRGGGGEAPLIVMRPAFIYHADGHPMERRHKRSAGEKGRRGKKKKEEFQRKKNRREKKGKRLCDTSSQQCLYHHFDTINATMIIARWRGGEGKKKNMAFGRKEEREERETKQRGEETNLLLAVFKPISALFQKRKGGGKRKGEKKVPRKGEGRGNGLIAIAAKRIATPI